MEAVRAFNNELSSLYESKPPVSRAKMAAVTKGALKAIKFYKHVVQSVEKFIQKCRPEYKVPGLYVIDSIVRQSRHQFGSEKDMFAPRFMKNICFTFQNLFKCPAEEKSKIVRVLNLWQKNSVFPSSVVQPLLDLAADPNNPQQFAKTQHAIAPIIVEALARAAGNIKQQAVDGQASHGGGGSSSGTGASTVSTGAANTTPAVAQPAGNEKSAVQNDVLKAVTQLLQQSQQTGATLTRETPQHPLQAQSMSLTAQQQQLQQLQMLQQQLIQQSAMLQHPHQLQQPIIDSNLLAQIQALTNQLLQKTQDEAKPPEPTFNKTLLDFDYGESDDEEERKDGHAHNPPHQNSVPAPGSNVQNLLGDPNIMHQLREMSATLQRTEQIKSEINIQEERHRLLQQQQHEFNQQIQHPPTMHHPPAGHPEAHPHGHPHHPPPGHPQGEPILVPHTGDMNQNDEHEARDFREKGHRPERSRSRSPKRRRRSRSRSRERRRRSRSRERHRRSGSRERERADRERKEKEKEKERERRKRGLPLVKERCVSICSTTIWLGHLSKNTAEEDLHSEVSKFGDIESIHLVPPRGCAFILMAKRNEAQRALSKLKGAKLFGSTVKAAWAMNKGIKESMLKDFWDVEVGVTYIPWNQLPPSLDPLAEGGLVDEDSLPSHLKDADADVIVIGETTLEQEATAQSLENIQLPDQMPPQAAPRQAPPQQPANHPPPPQNMLPFPGQPLPGVVPIMPPMGVMPPMMMPGQFPPPPMSGIHGMPGSQLLPGSIPMPRGMPPMMPGMPGQPPVSMQMTTPASQGGDATPTQSELTDKPQMTPPGSSSSQLAQNIQNIVASSAGLVVQQTPGLIRPGTPGSMVGLRPGPPGAFGQMPPLNFRLPPPGFDPRNPMMGMPPGAPGLMGPQPPMPRPGMVGQAPRLENPGMMDGPRPVNILGEGGPKPPTPERGNERNMDGPGIRMENMDGRGIRMEGIESPRLRLDGPGGRLEALSRGIDPRDIRMPDIRMGAPDGQMDSMEHRDDRFGRPPMDQRPGMMGGPRMGAPGNLGPRGMPGPNNVNGPVPGGMGQNPQLMGRFPGGMPGPRIQINMPGQLGQRFQGPNGPGGFNGPRGPMGNFPGVGRGIGNFQGNGPGPGGFRPPNLNMPIRIGFGQSGAPGPQMQMNNQMSPMKGQDGVPRFGAKFPPPGDDQGESGEFGRFGPQDDDQDRGPMRDEFNRFGRGEDDRFGGRDRRFGDGGRGDFRREFDQDMDRDRDRDRRGDDRNFGRDRYGGRDRDREDRDRGQDREERDRDRSDRDRDRERDRDRDRRDRSRSDRDRDRDKGDRPRERERDRDRSTRRSRWSNIEESKDEQPRMLPFPPGAGPKIAEDPAAKINIDTSGQPSADNPAQLGSDAAAQPGTAAQPNAGKSTSNRDKPAPVTDTSLGADNSQSSEMDMDIDSCPETSDTSTMEINVPTEPIGAVPQGMQQMTKPLGSGNNNIEDTDQPPWRKQTDLEPQGSADQPPWRKQVENQADSHGSSDQPPWRKQGEHQADLESTEQAPWRKQQGERQAAPEPETETSSAVTTEVVEPRPFVPEPEREQQSDAEPHLRAEQHSDPEPEQHLRTDTPPPAEMPAMFLNSSQPEIPTDSAPESRDGELMQSSEVVNPEQDMAIATSEPAALEAENITVSEPAPLEAEHMAVSESTPLEAEHIAPSEPAPLEAEDFAPSESAPLEAEHIAPSEPAPIEPEYIAPSEPAPLEAEHMTVNEPAPLEAEYSAPSEPAPLEAEHMTVSEHAPLEAEYIAPSEPASLEAEYNAPSEPAPVEAEHSTNDDALLSAPSPSGCFDPMDEHIQQNDNHVPHQGSASPEAQPSIHMEADAPVNSVVQSELESDLIPAGRDSIENVTSKDDSLDDAAEPAIDSQIDEESS